MKNNERAQAVVRYLAKKTGQNQYEIGRKLGYTNKSAFSAMLNGRGQIPSTLPERLAALDPAINIDFLKGASDKMLLGVDEQPLFIPAEPEKATAAPDPQKPQVPMGVYVPGELIRMLTKMSETIASQQETIRLLLENRTEEKGAAAGSGAL